MALLAILVITGGVVCLCHRVVALLLVLTCVLLCVNALLLQLHMIWLLGCIRVRLCNHVPILRTRLHILSFILGLLHQIGAVLPFVIRGQAGVHLAFLGACDLHPAHFPGTALCLPIRLGLGLTLGLTLIVRILLKISRRSTLLLTGFSVSSFWSSLGLQTLRKLTLKPLDAIPSA